jgi:hypothetical protein
LFGIKVSRNAFLKKAIRLFGGFQHGKFEELLGVTEGNVLGSEE